MNIVKWIVGHKEPLTVVLSTCALLVSVLALIRPWLKDWRENRNAVFQALQGDRKAIALVTVRVTNGEWNDRLRTDDNFRKKLLQSLAIAAGLEGSDRGKSYVLAAIKHVAKQSEAARADAATELRKVDAIFEAYVASRADPSFEEDRLAPFRLLAKAVEADAQQVAAADRAKSRAG
jgi:hypothetical protein